MNPAPPVTRMLRLSTHTSYLNVFSFVNRPMSEKFPLPRVQQRDLRGPGKSRTRAALALWRNKSARRRPWQFAQSYFLTALTEEAAAAFGSTLLQSPL